MVVLDLKVSKVIVRISFIDLIEHYTEADNYYRQLVIYSFLIQTNTTNSTLIIITCRTNRTAFKNNKEIIRRGKLIRQNWKTQMLPMLQIKSKKKHLWRINFPAQR